MLKKVSRREALKAGGGRHARRGGGTAVQKKYGIIDSPDLLFADLTDWSVVQLGAPLPTAERAMTSTGNGLIQPLLAAAAKAGAEILLQHRMASIHREANGRVTGIAVTGGGRTFNIRARGLQGTGNRGCPARNNEKDRSPWRQGD